MRSTGTQHSTGRLREAAGRVRDVAKGQTGPAPLLTAEALRAKVPGLKAFASHARRIPFRCALCGDPCRETYCFGHLWAKEHE